jgi:hypothetical protein
VDIQDYGALCVSFGQTGPCSERLDSGRPLARFI